MFQILPLFDPVTTATLLDILYKRNYLLLAEIKTDETTVVCRALLKYHSMFDIWIYTL